MTTIHFSDKAMAEQPILMSWLRGSGVQLRQGGKADTRNDAKFVVTQGEALPAPRRTVVIGNGADRFVIPATDDAPAEISFGHEDAIFGHAFTAELLRAEGAPTAADPATMALFQLAERVAGSDVSVLINGPTGTGKEVLARHIHNSSPRRNGPFIAVNCAALPETMLEALLFGHTKGAFTGAAGAAEGFFRAANGGTLLLDEIAEMPLGLQAKLLRALQEREVVPLGATKAEPIDVRIVACANRDLPLEIEEGRFRADLYYRLSVFPLQTQPLCERRQDIAALTAAMILRHVGNRRPVPFPTLDALNALQAHDWPGNVRELENVIQRALLLAPGDRIERSHLVFDMTGRRQVQAAPAPIGLSGAAPLGKVVQLSEFAAIRETLAACGGSRIETARRLGISERTLRYRLAKARDEGEVLDVRSA
ncbi:sigma-54 interaction domain-containing protein [Sphingomonas sp. ID0503]|uniref:sigma-54 interaction domain-containing protein n=1 Tax=Sphingomonas sp. ID0503 TaxID=3399691 RepID=UPI003AFB29DD